MATVVLSAAGAAIGGSLGGTVLGLSSVAVGRFVGATIGRAIDQKLLGQGSDVVETGRVDRFRLTQASEGNAVARVYGRMRVGGQVIWSTRFIEDSKVTGGGKGTSSGPKTRTYSYTVSLAIALCEGQISGVSRLWADGVEIAQDEQIMRVYHGSDDQLPDPKMEAVEGEGAVPAYRGTAYVVFEDLDLSRFGNRVPQFSFEVSRPAPMDLEGHEADPSHAVSGVALIPGTGEYALATEPVHFEIEPGETKVVNINSPTGRPDFNVSMDMLRDQLPNARATSLVVSWFGDDLRCGECLIKPKVESREFDGHRMPWVVSGLVRENAEEIVQIDERPVYGGTPADGSVIEAIHKLNELGQEVMFYPFILMDQLSDNGLPDPWTDGPSQAALPWRGRITLSKAPGQDGSPDGTASADGEVDAFFGTAAAEDFTVSDGAVGYSGPNEWRYRRFILHCAALCAAAGGVSAFCIGSEMRALTQIRGAQGVFSAVQHLRVLTEDVRAILGPDVKITYAADWSEYFGYQPQDGSGDRYFHLDPLWAHPDIDFIGIDNYMRLSDWRDGRDHLDAEWGAVYNAAYLRANIEGGEGYDWYYHSPEARAAQIRTDITDDDHDEPWIWRYKDIRNWWLNAHHERIGGVRQATATDWEPQSKPVWFTELGCAAVDRGTNQPNKFVDPKSSESRLPHYSDGRREDLMQVQYLRAMFSYWTDPANNPQSEEYAGRMIDMSRAHVWCWDTRPYPAFPNNVELWSDGENYPRGHWLNGRVTARSLASVVAEICKRAGLEYYDVSELYGLVRGYVVSEVTDARAALQPLMLRHGFDAVERDGTLRFLMRDGRDGQHLERALMAETEEVDGAVEKSRGSEVELAGRVRLRFVQADGDFDIQSEEAILAGEATHAVATTEMPLAMTRAEGRQTVERWLNEAQVSREMARFALPPSRLDLGAGNIVVIPGEAGEGDARYRIDRVETGASQLIEAVRIEPEVYTSSDIPDEAVSLQEFVPPVPVKPLFLDLPLMSGDETPHAPHIAVAARPWPGTVAVYDSDEDADYALNQIVAAQSVIGRSQTPLQRARPGLFDRKALLKLRLTSGQLQGISQARMLNGGNLAAIGGGESGGWEIIQFRDAELVDKRTYILTHLLRGQFGTDAMMPDEWVPGSWFVLLNGRPQQIDQASAHRRIARHYRIGPARRSYDDPSFLHRIEAFDGIGLRPYAPCRLRGLALPGGGRKFTWVRRTRIDGDSWDGPEVPLGEESESYHVRVSENGNLLREATVDEPAWTYSQAMQTEDAPGAGAIVQVAQISGKFGPGLYVSTGL